MQIDESKIWVLGNENPGSGQSISWIPKKITSFADCDILIVDTTSLNDKLMRSMNIEDVQSLFNEIQKRFNTGLLIICIASESFSGSVPTGRTDSFFSVNNYFWSPIGLNYKIIPPGKKLKKLYKDNFLFDEYVDSINEWSLSMSTDPIVKEYYPSYTGTTANANHIIVSNSDDMLGGEFFSTLSNGSVIFLPPLETSEKSLNKIFEILGIHQQTPTPLWASDIKISGTSDIMKKLQKIDTEIKDKQQEKNKLNSYLEKLNNFRKLVYETDDELENIVQNALELLGLSKVQKGKPGKDDLLFNFSKNKTYSLCSVEVKGIGGSLKLRDLRQSNNWVEDQLEYNKIIAKGLVICNTFRNVELKKSLKERNEISAENLQYAQNREICILPSHVLLDLCNHIFDGSKPDVKKIEDAIANTNGILTLKSLK